MALGSMLVVKLASDRPTYAPNCDIDSHRAGDTWLVGGASYSGGAVIRALVDDEQLHNLTVRYDLNAPTGFDCYPLLKPCERFPVTDTTYPPRLEPRPTDDAVFFQATLARSTRIGQRAYKQLVELGAPQLASMRSVGEGARDASWTSMREKALAVRFLPARSVEAAVGTASMVLHAKEEAR